MRHEQSTLFDLKIEWEKYEEHLHTAAYPAKTELLHEGAIADRLFIIRSGSIRLGYTKKGRDCTFQFFFEGHIFTAIESYMGKIPSPFFIETIEPTVIYSMKKETLAKLARTNPEMKNLSEKIAMNRMMDYSRLLLECLRDTPEQRYHTLIATRPYLFKRVPQRLIASYLGITTVSLSRIKARKR